ncbi:hypothetical protein CXG81DRAFT_17663 [Caulochytrium protostelioides]|uniref:Uncharacterized protein n=1 Tax=Caulochytrium protostelioides TaxID=1555241 RepID=A0A4P9XBB5_9FUNG|nr:hypothetical protein CXG81DRAFT_17663 [Caulochytrium protostelioides]|eukprot:RKP02693.1 hypothetical protein CXG81DRAFT_17663 [Caulochytrium protostelioides]
MNTATITDTTVTQTTGDMVSHDPALVEMSSDRLIGLTGVVSATPWKIKTQRALTDEDRQRLGLAGSSATIQSKRYDRPTYTTTALANQGPMRVAQSTPTQSSVRSYSSASGSTSEQSYTPQQQMTSGSTGGGTPSHRLDPTFLDQNRAERHSQSYRVPSNLSQGQI